MNLQVAIADKGVLKRLISQNHYSRTCSSITYGFGIWLDDRLVGGIVYSAGVGRSPNAYCPILKPTDFIELTRLWVDDSAPTNTESQAVSVTLRAIKRRRGRFKAVLSYADEMVGHVGIIYQAMNFFYMGQSSSGTSRMRIGDKTYSTRSISSRFGTNDVQRLRKILGRDDIQRVNSEARKHVYLYPLTKEVRDYCAEHCQPYPKRQKDSSEPLGDPPREGGAAPTLALQHYGLR